MTKQPRLQFKEGPKVYMAGKVTVPRGGNFRDYFFDWYKPEAKRFNEIAIDLYCEETTIPKSIHLSDFTYIGPYYIVDPEPDECYTNHGIADRGSKQNFYGCHCPQLMRHVVARYNKAAIEQCDLFMCYINTLDCYGTLSEIGYAMGLGKSIVYYIEPDVEDTYWHLRQMLSEYCPETATYVPLSIVKFIQHKVNNYRTTQEIIASNAEAEGQKTKAA